MSPAKGRLKAVSRPSNQHLNLFPKNINITSPFATLFTHSKL